MLSIKNLVRGLGSVGLGLAAALSLAGSGTGQVSTTKASAAEGQRQLREASQNFVPNVGQWDARAKFLARSRNMNVWVTERGLTFDYHEATAKNGESAVRGHVVSMEIVGSAKPSITPSGKSSFRFGYVLPGTEKTTFASTYREVRAEDRLPGVDLRVYHEGNRPRYDVIVAPGTKVSDVKLRFKGAGVKVEPTSLAFTTELGTMKHDDLFAYQVVDGARKQVPAKFRSLGNGDVGFVVGNYDPSKPLVIDPLVYGSYYGGDNGFDDVRSVAGDADGGVYMVGSTRATQFPVIQGPYFLNLNGGQDAWVAKLQGDAYRHDYCVFLGGTQAETAQWAKLDPFGNLWVAGETFSTDFPGNTRRSINILSQTGGLPASGGTFRLQHGTVLTAPIPWNATTADVKAAVDLAFGGNSQVTSLNGLQLPAGRYKISLDNNLPLRLTVVNTRTIDPDTFVETNAGLPSTIQAWPFGPTNLTNLYTVQELRHRGSTPLFPPVATAATFQIIVRDVNGNQGFTLPIRQDATPGQVQASLVQVVGAGNVTVTGGGPLFQHPHTVVFGGTFGAAQPKLQIINQPQPNPVYSIFRPSDIFVIRFRRDGELLDPLQNATLMIGGEDENENLTGFAVVPASNPSPTDPVRLAVLGETSPTNPIPGIAGVPNATGTTGFLMRFSFDGTLFNPNNPATRYIATGGVGASIRTTGLAVDASGAAYMAGTVSFAGTVDNRGPNPVFTVTPGIFNEGWFLRNTDMFVRKYAETGSLVYSGLIGGNNIDIAGGLYTDITGEEITMGSSIDVDPLGNAYVVGTTTSFNYPRTRGVFGETFDNDPNVVVTKVSAAGDQIVYSTNLRTRGSVFPSGIAVDARGNAYVTGMTTRNPLTFPVPPGDPNEPNAMAPAPTVQLTGDALDPDYETPDTPELPTVEGWINVLNPTASTLIYGSYVGGFLDELVYGPTLDAFGDVWVFGWSDSYRYYQRVSSTGNVTEYETTATLPASLITPLAFKAQGDAATSLANGTQTVLYGLLESPFTGPAVISAAYRRDGFLFKQRINLPIVTNLVLDPATIPGGLGATSTGSVTLSQPAPIGGAEINVTLSNTSVASLSSTTDLATAKFTIPQGATTGTFVIFSKAVLEPGSVDVKAEYLNTFRIQRLTVIPWLETVAVIPDTLVGGNNALGRVTLARPAPVGGVTVDLLTDRPDLVSYPDNNGSNTVVVPAGQTSATFTVRTGGVATATPVAVNASLLGVVKSAPVVLTVASLDRIELTPTPVAGGSTVSGTVFLNGASGSNMTVDLSIVGGLPAGYAFQPGATLTFAQGETQKDFTITTPFEAVDVTRIVRATRPVQGDYPFSQVESSIRVLAVNLVTFTIDPTTVNGGDTSIGTITISQPAPAGGVTLTVDAPVNGAAVTIPTSVTIPAGEDTASFDIVTAPVIPQTVASIRVSRGPVSITRQLTINGITATIALVPPSVIGGAQNATGAVTLSRPAPAGGVTVDLVSSDPAVGSVTPSVTIPAGDSSAPFTVTTFEVPTTTSITIQSSIMGVDQGSAALQVRRRSFNRIFFTPSQVRSLRTTFLTVVLDAPARAGGAQVNLSATNGSLLTMPSSVVVPAGQTSITVPVLTRRVSRDLSTTVTATLYNGATSTTTVTVLR